MHYRGQNSTLHTLLPQELLCGLLGFLNAKNAQPLWRLSYAFATDPAILLTLLLNQLFRLPVSGPVSV
jgi:hypothetical protein